MNVRVGVDLVDCPRIEKIVKKRGEKFLKRVFTEGELEYCKRHRMSTPCLAARFAVKEAVLKLLGTGLTSGIKWLDVEVYKLETGKPEVKLHGKAYERARRIGLQHIQVSLSHLHDYAVAVAVGVCII